MARREFEPAGLLAGLLFLAIAAGGGCEVAGLWHPRPVLVVPVLIGGLLVVRIVGAATTAARRRRGTARDPAGP